MGQRYVNQDTGSDVNDGSINFPWLTIQHGVSNVVMGDTLNVWPATYAENVTVTVDGAANFPITLQRDPRADVDEDVVLDGTGGQRAIQFLSRLYWNVDGIVVRNDGGGVADTFVYGIFVGSATTIANAQGCHELHFTNVTVEGVNRNLRNDCLGVPCALLSYGDETGGGTATRNITWDFCTFQNCTTERRDHVIGTGFFSVSGNVKDIAWRDCLFDNALGADFISGIDGGGNVLPGANPDRPRQMVFLRNTVRDIIGTAFYDQALFDILIEGSTFVRCGFGVEANTEPQVSAHYDITKRLWVRGNVFIDNVNTALVAGAWDATYDDVSDIWYTNNTIWQSTDPGAGAPFFLLGGNQAVPGKLGVIGDSKCRNNVVFSPGNLIISTLPAGSTMALDYNLYASTDPTPFEWLSVPNLAFPYVTTQEVHSYFESDVGVPTFLDPTLKVANGFHLRGDSKARGMGLSADPSWYYPGIFGAYDPEVERDVFGILRRVTPRDMGGAVWNPGGVVARAIPVPTSSSSGAWVDVSGFGYMKTFAVTGNLVGTVNIDMSNEDTPGTAGAPVATFPAGRGNIAVASAAHWMRVRVGGYKSGAAIAQVSSTNEGARFVELVGEVDTTGLGLDKSVYVTGAFRGGLSIETSLDDGTTWFEVMTFTAPGVQHASFPALLMRVVRDGVPDINPGAPTVWVGGILTSN